MASNCATCGTPLKNRRKKYCEEHRPKTIFEDPARYGTYEGDPGDPDQWREAFRQRFSPAEIREFLGERTPWEVLGIPVGASLAEIKRAYRRRALETHPDHHPGIDPALFRDINAAYQQLTEI